MDRITILEGDAEQAVARLEALAKLMDSAFVIPGTNVRMGFDALIGIVPGVGDLISGAISSYLIWEARQLGASRWLIARMSANTLLDTTIGIIPVVGDAFDLMYRANSKNMALLRKHIEKKGLAARAGDRTAPPVIEGESVRIS